MNKLINEFCIKHSLNVENDNCAHGFIMNYETNLCFIPLDNVSPVRLFISCFVPDDKKEAISKQLNDLNYKHLKYDFTQFGLVVGLNAMTLKKLMAVIDDIVDSVYGILKNNEILDSSYCPICGNSLDETNSYVANVAFGKVTIDNDCKEKINQTIEKENKEFDDAPNNYLKGLAGALVGALISVVAFIVLYMIGFISAITSFLSIYLGITFYKKFGGKPNKTMVLIVTAVTIIVMALTIFGIYVYAANLLATSRGYTSSGINAFIDMMNEDDFRKEFSSNAAMTALFTLLGCGFEVFSQMQKVKRSSTI